MTTYVLQQGYAYGHQDELDEGELLQICRGIDLDALRDKAIEYGLNPHKVAEFVSCYRELPTDDLTLRELSPNVVTQLASGSGPDRLGKEIMRRAFAVLVLDEAFRRGKSVQLCIT